ncbi:MAG: DUF1579 domain-containing protein [Bacteroidia bacterium]
MKKTNIIAMTIALTCSCIAVNAQDTKQPQAVNADVAKPNSEQAAMEKAWMAYMTPGPMHEMLAKCNGDWKEDITMWMAPGAPPTKSTSVCSNTMILGGRYQQSTHKGDFNGMPFEGISTVAYDNALKMYISTWIDNMGTGIMYMKGTFNEKNHMLTSTGKMVDPMTGKEINVRETFKFVDDNKQVMEMFETREGKERKTMEITYTR